MELSVTVPDDLASHVNEFAAENDVAVDRAYELFVSVGVETLGDVDMEVYVEDGRLILECPACASIFEDPVDALVHDCE